MYHWKMLEEKMQYHTTLIDEARCYLANGLA